MTEETGFTAVTVLGEISAERIRQLTELGFTAAHDDKKINGQLARGASYYILYSAKNADFVINVDSPAMQVRGTRRDLIKAAALIVAEIERLDRVAYDAQMTLDASGGAFDG